MNALEKKASIFDLKYLKTNAYRPVAFFHKYGC